MSVPNGVKIAASTLAAGIRESNDGVRVKITVTLQPASAGPLAPDEEQVDLSKWPTTIRALKAFWLRIALPSSDPRAKPQELLRLRLQPIAGKPAAPATEGHVQGLWERVMAGQDAATRNAGWDAMRTALADMTKPSPQKGAQRIVVPPTHLAALSYPFERGRLALDALAKRGSLILTRDPARGPSQAAGGVVTAVAALDRPTIASDADPSALAIGTAPLEPPPGARFRAEHVARAAMGHHGGLGAILHGVRAAHHAATPIACQTNPKDADDRAEVAKRRLAALQGAPVLQRLFGMAIDFETELPRHAQLGADGFFLLAVEMDNGEGALKTTPLWTLTKLRHQTTDASGYFGPATRAEAGLTDGALGAGGNAPTSIEGIEILARDQAPGQPAFTLATVDPELAIEGDLGNLRGKGSVGPTTLRSGGLRLLDLHRDVSVKAGNDLTAASQKRANAASTSSDDVVQDADDLHPLNRLDLGLDTARGPAWRCTGHRIVRYQDPFPGPAPADWVETELTRLLGPSNGSLRVELDAATVFRSTITVTPDQNANRTELPAGLSADDAARANAQADADKDQANRLDGFTVTIAGATVAAWGGEPMGAPTVRSDCPVGEELAISRTISLPSSQTGDRGALLSMPMRFGWPYRVGMRRVYPGGICSPLVEAAVRYGRTGGQECLPAMSMTGRRLLRHERVEAPLLAMLDGEAADRKGKMPKQGAAHVIVRSSSSPDLATPRIARRILAAPNVPLHFATLHDVFRAWRPERGSKSATPPGGPLDGRLRGGQGEPILIDVHRRVASGTEHTPTHAHAKSDPVYPDPAASVMVLRLRSPLSADAWLDEPIIVPIQGSWPDVPPVLVELHAEAPSPTRLKYMGLGSAGDLRSRMKGGGLKAYKVQAALRPAEDLFLDAWCVPTIDQLADWFDVIETAGVLAAHETGQSAHPDASCAEALSRLFDSKIDPSAPLPKACYSAGGLASPTRNTLRSLAAMLYHSMLREPIASLGGVQSLRLTHAVSYPQAAPKLTATGPAKLTLVRRVFAGGNASADGAAKDGETRLDFIGKVPIERWTETASEEAATSVLFGGAFEVDLASTASIALEVECADPSTNRLDDAEHRGRTPAARASHEWSLDDEGGLRKLFGFAIRKDRTVELPTRKVVPVRIDGLPPSPDGAPGPHRLTLEGLQAISWNGKPDDNVVPEASRPALRTMLDGVFATTGARLLRVTPVATGRHANLMHPDGVIAGTDDEHFGAVRGKPFDLWMPATQRPAPPVVDEVEMRLGRMRYESEVNGTRTVGVRQSSHIRVRLARPWYSSGQGERLGLVLWPPSIFFRDPPTIDDAGQALPDEIDDLDLGPVGPFVTRWGAESSDGPTNALSQFIPPTAFSIADDDPALRVPVAFMPLPSNDASPPANTSKPGQTAALHGDAKQPAGALSGGAAAPAPNGVTAPGGTSKDDTAKPAGETARATEFAAVALLTSEPRFDIEQETWFVDFELQTERLHDPYVRLGLVRYQPHAREDAAPQEGQEPVRLRVSSPVSASARVLPTRAAEVTWRKAPSGGTDVYVTVRVSRPVGDASGVGPAARVTLTKRRKSTAPLPSQQLTAFASDGSMCSWESWSNAVHDAPRPSSGLTSFTCLFNLPGEIEDEHSIHVALVETFSRRPPATYGHEPVSDESLEPLVESGPDFLAALELKTTGVPTNGSLAPAEAGSRGQTKETAI